MSTTARSASISPPTGSPTICNRATRRAENAGFKNGAPNSALDMLPMSALGELRTKADFVP